MPSGHGGKRAGSGRPPQLSFRRRTQIGIWCEELVSVKTDERRQELLARRLGAEEIRCEQTRFRSASAGHGDSPLTPTETMEDASTEIDAAAGPHARRLRLRKPKGLRRAIVRLVAAEAQISERLVDQCWKEYRAWLRNSRAS